MSDRCVTITATNVSCEKRGENVRDALKRGAREYKPEQPHDRICILVGGGPSVQKDLFLISALTTEGEIFGVNNIPRYLAERGLDTDIHVLMDADPGVESFVVPQLKSIRYYASQCDPRVLDLAGKELIIWHAASQCLDDISGLNSPLIGGGSTTATRALYLAYGLGYRKFHIFGMDSSYDGERAHAYAQHPYETTYDVVCGEEVFKSAPQLIAQAEDFKMVLPDLIRAACQVTVHGDGLLRAIATQMAA